MKSMILAVSLAVAAAGFSPLTVEARRIGGGGASGMQRSLPSRAPTPLVPAAPAQAVPAPAPVVPGAAPQSPAPRRSWMGPVTGLAAGLGIAALMSHFGMGEGLGNVVMLVLLAFAAFAALRWAMARMTRGPAPMATPNGAGPVWNSPRSQPVPSAAGPVAPANSLPAGFDAPGFERIAKMIFIRMQAANDRADLDDLRNFTTPEMFASVRLDLQERGNLPQTTDVVQIDAQVLDVATESARQVVSVRFHGLIREETNGVAAPFDEIWHLVRPADGSREWAIAGIQQAAAA